MEDVVTIESELWSRSLDGDSAAFGELFDRLENRVFRHAHRLIENRHDAEDVTATAFLELWRRRADVRVVNGSVLPWLLVTATNSARNARRSTRRYRALLDALPREADAADAESDFLRAHPLDAMDHRLAVAMGSLNPADARLVSLVVLEGFTIAEAAGILGLTPSAAKTRLHRARLRLRAAVGDDTAGDDVGETSSITEGVRS